MFLIACLARQGQELAAHYQAFGYVECSAKKQENITAVFQMAGAAALLSKAGGASGGGGGCCVLL